MRSTRSDNRASGMPLAAPGREADVDAVAARTDAGGLALAARPPPLSTTPRHPPVSTRDLHARPPTRPRSSAWAGVGAGSRGRPVHGRLGWGSAAARWPLAAGGGAVGGSGLARGGCAGGGGAAR